MDKKKLLALVEGAVMVAMAFGLSCVWIVEMPWGGKITLLSMLPIVVYSIRNGVKYGLLCSFAYSLTQLAQGIFMDGMLGWGLTPVMLISCMFLDYVGAFTVIGFAGVFRKKEMKGWIVGTVSVIFVRYLLHVVSGAVIFATAGKLWEGLNITNPWLYSTVYNACFMLPELILTTIGAVLLFRTGVIKMIIKKAAV